MKTRIYVSLGMLLLLLAPFGCSDSEAVGILPPDDPEFEDVNKPMEYYTPLEEQGRYYSYFRFQNASDYPVIFAINSQLMASMEEVEILPGQQGTWLQTMEPYSWIEDPNLILIEDLKALGWIHFYFNVPPEDERPEILPGIPRPVWHTTDTCAMYSFFEPTITSETPTPRDQSQWVFEKVDENSVRWTYRITNGDHDEAVRQTLERWADRDKEEK